MVKDGKKEKKDEKPAPGKLFPEKKIPKGIKNLARAMKKAEIARKGFAENERDMREKLQLLMEKEKCRRFQLDVDGVDYEFELEGSLKVKSKKLQEDD